MRIFVAQAVVLLWLPLLANAQFDYTNDNGTLTITGYTGSGGNVIIPDAINSYPVTAIGTNAFLSCTAMTNVMIPDSVTNISQGAFGSCSGLASVTIPDSITNIGDYVFASCFSLTNATIPNTVTSIGVFAFGWCIGLKSVMIPSNLAGIGDFAFNNCTSLTNVTIPSSVTNIGTYAFLNCSNLSRTFFEGDAPGVDGNAGSADSTVFYRDNPGMVYYLPGTSGWGTTFGGWLTATWYQPQPQILGSSDGLGVLSNGFQFTISWSTNTAVVVEASTNLQNWIPLTTNMLVNGTNRFFDPSWTNYPQRFYRVSSQ